MLFDMTLVTHDALPLGSPDDKKLAACLRDRGLSVRLSPWNDGSVDWSQSCLTVIRSTWDYHRDPERWMNWLSHVEACTELLNPPAALRWNTNKLYLRRLSDQQVPIVPTEFVDPLDGRSLIEIAETRGWSDIVLKPAVAASSFGIGRYRGKELTGAGQRHLDNLRAPGTALVQPFIAGLERCLERSLVFIDGKFSHAFKKPAFNDNVTGSTAIDLYRPSLEDLLFGFATLSGSRESLLFARVDIVDSESGLMLMELELIEPDLGLRLSPDFTSRLADACAARHKAVRDRISADAVITSTGRLNL